jgi:hypothetical protein
MKFFLRLKDNEKKRKDDSSDMSEDDSSSDDLELDEREYFTPDEEKHIVESDDETLIIVPDEKYLIIVPDDYRYSGNGMVHVYHNNDPKFTVTYDRIHNDLFFNENQLVVGSIEQWTNGAMVTLQFVYRSWRQNGTERIDIPMTVFSDFESFRDRLNPIKLVSGHGRKRKIR